MTEAVIVSTARTPIAKAYRGSFNNLGGASLGAASVAEAVKRAGIDPAEVDDVIMGAALQQGATGANIARQVALRAQKSESYVAHIIPLAFLAPRIQQAIMDGTQPLSLTLETLIRTSIPREWKAQETLFGVDSPS